MSLSLYDRDMTEEEYTAAMQRYGPSRPSPAIWVATIIGTLVVMSMLGLIALGLLAYVLVPPASSRAAYLCVATVAVIAIGTVVFVLGIRREYTDARLTTQWNAEMRRIIERRRVVLLHVSTDEVVRIGEHEDEGCKYCYRVADRKCILIRGDVEDFACNDVEIVRLSGTDRVIAIHYLGEEIEPVADLDPVIDRNVNPGGVVFDCDWDKMVRGETTI